jgi:hypothetical protein
MIHLSSRWASQLSKQPEAGMGYQIVSVVLKNGQKLDQVVVVDGCITQVRGLENVPFTEEEIGEMVVTNDKWDFGKE